MYLAINAASGRVHEGSKMHTATNAATGRAHFTTHALVLSILVAAGAVTAATVTAATVAAAATDAAGSECAMDQSPRPRVIAHRGASAERPESTLAAFCRAIEIGADAIEIDVRTSQDGVLFLLHDPTLDRTTDGAGPAAQRTIAELQALDAGGRFDASYRGERIPTLVETLELCRGKIDVLLDLKEDNDAFAKAVADAVLNHGDPARTIVGVRSASQARIFRRLLPDSRQLGFIPAPKDIDAFAEAGVEMIRLWPQWIAAPDGAALVQRVRGHGRELQLNGTTGTPQDVLPLLEHQPDAILVDDPVRLKATLDAYERHAERFAHLRQWLAWSGRTTIVPWLADRDQATFLNRDYAMLELPDGLVGQPRLMFAGGAGDRVELRCIKPCVVFAAFEYNTSGGWSFPDGLKPSDLGWRVVKQRGYRGGSNATIDGQPHYADVYCRALQPDELLDGLPPWWLILAILSPDAAREVPGFEAAMAAPMTTPPFVYSQWATRPRPLQVPEFESAAQWSQWQRQMRDRFRQRLVFPYEAAPTAEPIGEPVERGRYVQREWQMVAGSRRLFRFFRLEPKSADGSSRMGSLATIVCFMGHGKIEQVLDQPDSYQHACAARFAEQGYLVFAMENVGMEPGRDTHAELDRILRLDGYGWYSLLFAHQQMLLDHVFADARERGAARVRCVADPTKVGVTGVSTGGLLALSAAALDPRVAAASVQGIFGSMRTSFIRDRKLHCACGAIPGLLPEFDLPELALLVAPRRLHVSNATNDGFGPDEARRCVQQITPLYVRAGGPPPIFTVPPGRHEFAFEPAAEFFRSTLGTPDAANR